MTTRSQEAIYIYIDSALQYKFIFDNTRSDISRLCPIEIKETTYKNKNKENSLTRIINIANHYVEHCRYQSINFNIYTIE